MVDAASLSPKTFLLTLIAKLHLGEVAADIILALFFHGRLTCAEISSRCKLPIKKVKAALVSLIQLHCLNYWQTGKTVFYLLNEDGLWIFVHSGDIVNHIHSVYDAESAQIIQNIILVGNVRVQDYTGVSKGDDKKAIHEENQRFVRLFQDGWLIKVQHYHFSPIQDLWDKLYQETLKLIPRLATTSEIKRVNEAKEKTKVKLTELFEELSQDPNQFYELDSGIRKLKPLLVVRFNLERFEKHLRTRAFTAFARARVGAVSAKIFEKGLMKIENKSPAIKHYFSDISGLINDPDDERLLYHSIENKAVDQKETTFNIRDIERLTGDLDFRGTILTRGKRFGSGLNSSSSAKRVKLEDSFLAIPEEKDEDEIESVNDQEGGTPDLGEIFIPDHLKLLASSTSVSFLIEISPGNYTVPFIQLSQELKQHSFDSIVKSSLGLDCFRILRCLRSLKLADEKSIANTILLKEKSVRNELCKLVSINAVEIQEIPRLADRAASKTFFVFRHKSYGLYQYLGDAILHNMAQVLQNIREFKLDNKILLDKCEREDVKGNEEQLLLESELKVLRDLQKREIGNVGKFNRLKGIYDVFGLLR